ncbi:hypothetical protein IX84_13880 [Phaeodactylibacter xiamenensis]|uniref:Uncharacterized protein n=1 Tax=Phaeodactylibacter xiamenensis TaxID=1524460 RepID=A0A098S683_9BACT|nr:hypothetical protein IX84_13880 [Phaeodactylibacter xiamenensis]
MQNGILKGFSAKIFKISENPYFFCLSFQTFNELFAELKVYGNENNFKILQPAAVSTLLNCPALR